MSIAPDSYAWRRIQNALAAQDEKLCRDCLSVLPIASFRTRDKGRWRSRCRRCDSHRRQG